MTKLSYENNRTAEDAFMLLLKKYREGNGKNDELENLYNYSKDVIESLFKEETGQEYTLTKEDFLQLIEDKYTKNIYVKNLFRNKILDISYQTIGENGKSNLGNYIQGGFNSSGWLWHVLQVAEFATDLAASLGLDPNTAKKLAILHDIGRSQDHTFSHTEKGEEILKQEGWNEEAPICLTHSYLTGDYVANNELTPKWWSLDEHGNTRWEEGTKPERAEWLENYQSNEYDLVIQLADLLIEQRGNVDIKARLDGIKRRRESKGDNLDLQPNRAYFLTKLYNSIVNIMCKIDANNKDAILEDFPEIKYLYEDNGISKTRTVKEIEALLYDGENSLSKTFSNFYQKSIKGKGLTSKNKEQRT